MFNFFCAILLIKKKILESTLSLPPQETADDGTVDLQ